jgi:hypothetical protein
LVVAQPDIDDVEGTTRFSVIRRLGEGGAGMRERVS